MSYLYEGQLTTDTYNRKYVHMYTILFPVWAGIKSIPAQTGNVNRIKSSPNSNYEIMLSGMI